MKQEATALCHTMRLTGVPPPDLPRDRTNSLAPVLLVSYSFFSISRYFPI